MIDLDAIRKRQEYRRQRPDGEWNCYECGHACEEGGSAAEDVEALLAEVERLRIVEMAWRTLDHALFYVATEDLQRGELVKFAPTCAPPSPSCAHNRHGVLKGDESSAFGVAAADARRLGLVPVLPLGLRVST